MPLVVLLIGVAVVLVAHPFSHTPAKTAASTGGAPSVGAGSPSGGSAAASAPASPSATSPSPSPSVSEQQAAKSLATMLSRSVADRSDISNAATDVATCGPNVASDAQVFDKAASSRKALLTSLGTMPGRATLPASLTASLTRAWQASVAADQAYAQWAGDEAKGCKPNDTADPGYQATVTPNQNATKNKTAFAAGWNPIAARYHLTKYQQGQL